MNNTKIVNQPIRQRVSHSIERASQSLSTILRIHDQYSTLIGATQPLFDGIAHSIRNMCSSFWHSKPVTVATKAIGGSINQSKILQNGIQKIITVVTHKNPLSIRVKRHLLNQDPKIKKLKNIITSLEDKIQTSYCKVFNKPILMDKMKFSVKEYQTMTKHFQEFLSKNQDGSTSGGSFASDGIEDLIEFIEKDTLPDSQALREKVIHTIEILSSPICQPAEPSKDPKFLEATQAFQNCYFLFLAHELLHKFENGEIYKDDLLLCLKNYKSSPITSLLNDATIENIGEVCAGMLGEAITESSLAIALHRQVDKRILGPLLSISPLHSLLGSFSSYLGITLASYIGIKALGSEESLKAYIHNMTWATIASMITEYGLEISQFSNPVYTFLVPLLASSIAYNFSAVYEPVLKRKYLTETLSENHPHLIDTMEKLVEERCVIPVKEQLQKIKVQEIRNVLKSSVTGYIADICPYQIFSPYRKIKSLVEFVSDPMNELVTEISEKVCKELLLDKPNSEQSRIVVNYLLTKDLIFTSFIGKFSQFYEKLKNDENLLKDFYAHRSRIIESSSKFSSNNNIHDMPDMEDTLVKLICSISPLQGNSSIVALLLTKINDLFPTSLFQSFSKDLEKSFQSKIHPFSTMDPLFLEMLVKSFLITTLSEIKDLPGDIIQTDAFFLQSALKFLDSLIHINLIGQNEKKNSSIINYMVYKLIHAEIDNAIQSVPQMLVKIA